MNWLFRCVLACLVAGHGALGAAGLADQLLTGSFVLLVRHAQAPGVGDPAGFVLERCETQRVLDAQGKRQAARLGQWLRSQGVVQARVYTSPWCRCRETAELLGLGPVTVEPALASVFSQPDQAAARNQSLQAFIAQSLRVSPQRPLILVTHHFNIREFVGQSIGSGDMVLAQVTAQGQLVKHQWLASP